MGSLQNIQNGVTTGGFGALVLDSQLATDQFVKGQEIEQERRRKVIAQNDELISSTDLSKLSQADLDGENGITKQYQDFKTLGMTDPGKDFNRHSAALRNKHQSIQNAINSSLNVRKQNMAQYDDLKTLLPPEELIRMQEDMKKPSINSNGTQNLLDPSKYKLKAKDYLDVGKMVYDTFERNTGKSGILNQVRTKDGKMDKLTGQETNVKKAKSDLYFQYTNDTKTRESVDRAVATHNASSPTSANINPGTYLNDLADKQAQSQEGGGVGQSYKQGIYKPGNEKSYSNVNQSYAPDYVSHTTVKVDAGGKASEDAIKLYTSAHDSLSRFVLGKGDGDDAASKATKILKGASVDGGAISGVEPFTNTQGEKGFKVFFSDPIMGKFIEPKEYIGSEALRRLGLFYNQKQKAVAAQIVPDPAVPSKEKKVKHLAPTFGNAMQFEKKPVKVKAPAAKVTTKKNKYIDLPEGGKF
jgi:hypothetical protein